MCDLLFDPSYVACKETDEAEGKRRVRIEVKQKAGMRMGSVDLRTWHWGWLPPSLVTARCSGVVHIYTHTGRNTTGSLKAPYSLPTGSLAGHVVLRTYIISTYVVHSNLGSFPPYRFCT